MVFHPVTEVEYWNHLPVKNRRIRTIIGFHVEDITWPNKGKMTLYLLANFCTWKQNLMKLYFLCKFEHVKVYFATDAWHENTY